MGKIRKSKFHKMVKNVIQNHRKLYKINETPKSKTKFRCAKLRKNPETKVSRFLAFYPLIWPFQTLSRISNDGV